MTDQEQTERGASTVYVADHAAHCDCHLAAQKLHVALERVTAELAETDQILRNNQLRREEVEMRHGDLLRANRALEAERDAMREVVEAGKLVRDVLDDIRTQQREAEVVGRFDAALRSLDATRKATADATEEGK